MLNNQSKVTTRGESALSDLDAFLAEIKQSAPQHSGRRGRLIFALDATMSRQPTWDTACTLQGEMFREVATIGTLDVQLVYYRGLDECRASKWISDSAHLAKTMSGIDCRAGHTQIGKTLSHTQKETKVLQVHALVFVGDAMEESVDELAHKAGELGRLNVPAFMFQESDDDKVERTYREISRLTHGAYCRFDQGSARQLGELLRAVAAFAVGGLAALSARQDAGAVKLLSQLK